ncbi:MAG: hypothetical protein U5L00_01640 [Desulfovermiculus sp.]|nr:hypothetical protein [Desulfovermiculus sp.]
MDRYVPPEAEFWKVYEEAKGQDKVLLLWKSTKRKRPVAVTTDLFLTPWSVWGKWRS